MMMTVESVRSSQALCAQVLRSSAAVSRNFLGSTVRLCWTTIVHKKGALLAVDRRSSGLAGRS